MTQNTKIYIVVDKQTREIKSVWSTKELALSGAYYYSVLNSCPEARYGVIERELDTANHDH